MRETTYHGHPLKAVFIDKKIKSLVLAYLNFCHCLDRRSACRVLKPNGGRWIFIEHTAANAAQYGFLLPTLQRVCDPLQRALFGCSLLGDPARLIMGSGDGFGFRGIALEKFDLQNIPSAPMGGESIPQYLPRGESFMLNYDVSSSDINRAMRFNPALPHFLLSPHLSGILIK